MIEKGNLLFDRLHFYNNNGSQRMDRVFIKIQFDAPVTDISVCKNIALNV